MRKHDLVNRIGTVYLPQIFKVDVDVDICLIFIRCECLNLLNFFYQCKQLNWQSKLALRLVVL